MEIMSTSVRSNRLWRTAKSLLARLNSPAVVQLSKLVRSVKLKPKSEQIFAVFAESIQKTIIIISVPSLTAVKGSSHLVFSAVNLAARTRE